MSVTKKRKVYSPAFKAKVGLEALKGVKTINEIGQEYGVHPVQVGQWKKAIQEQAAQLFEGKRGPKPVAEHREPERLYSEIGKPKMELDWLKKSRGSACHDTPVMDWAERGCSGHPPVRVGRGVAVDGVRKQPGGGAGRRGSAVMPPDRRAIHASALLWHS
jgi:transposase-like protein